MSRRRRPTGQSEESEATKSPRSLVDSTAGGAPATADLAAARPTARQSLDYRGRARRYATCPEHHHFSRRYLGTTAAGWVFSCAIGPHQFTAPPDPTAPKTVYEAQRAAAWAKAHPGR